MYSLVMVAVMLAGQQPELDRDAFHMIVRGMEAPQATPAEPANRLIEDADLRKKVVAEANALASNFKDNNRDLRLRLTTKKLTDWLYGLPEVKGALTLAENIEFDKIIETELDKVIAEEAKPKTQPANAPTAKHWFWLTYGGYQLPIYGWKDASGAYRYYMHEQTTQVQSILAR